MFFYSKTKTISIFCEHVLHFFIFFCNKVESMCRIVLTVQPSIRIIKKYAFSTHTAHMSCLSKYALHYHHYCYSYYSYWYHYYHCYYYHLLLLLLFLCKYYSMVSICLVSYLIQQSYFEFIPLIEFILCGANNNFDSSFL